MGKKIKVNKALGWGKMSKSIQLYTPLIQGGGDVWKDKDFNYPNIQYAKYRKFGIMLKMKQMSTAVL